MKNPALTIFLLFSIIASAAGNEIKVKSTIKEVTVFLNGAEVLHQGNATINAGVSELVFENLSPFINQSNMQAKGEGDFIILGLAFRMNYLNEQPKSKEILMLEDSLEILQNKMENLKYQRTSFENEESFLLANKNIAGANTGVNAADLEKIANLLRTRLPEIRAKQVEIKRSEKKVQEQLTKINKQLQDINAKRNRNTGEIVVTVSAKTTVNANISLSYSVSNAGWTPYYDIRAIDVKSPVKLVHKANVFQETGEEWKNVKLSLSTGNPALGGVPPVIRPWYLSFDRPVYKPQAMAKAKQKSMEGRPSMAESETVINDAPVPAQSSADYTSIQENTTTFQYNIKLPYTIASGNKPQSVEIGSYDIPATYKHYVAPRLDKDVFLLAKITQWDQYNLMSGDANIFFEGSYVGKTLLNTASTKDTLELSLGRDKSIVADRKNLTDFSQKKFIGQNRKDTYVYEIEIRNKKKQPVQIEVEDQVPVSKISEIEVEVLETSSAKYDKDTGKLTWNLSLSPAEAKKVKFSYSVKYPKDRVIYNP